MSTGVGYASDNVWSRKARRRAMHAGNNETAALLPTVPDQVALGVRLQVTLSGHRPKEVEVVTSWIRGTDSVLFESFTGMIKRKMESK